MAGAFVVSAIGMGSVIAKRGAKIELPFLTQHRTYVAHGLGMFIEGRAYVCLWPKSAPEWQLCNSQLSGL